MRELIQKKLNEIMNLDSGPFVPDGIIEQGITYFGYSVKKNYINSDMDKNCTYRFSLIGFLVRKNMFNENTLDILDKKSLEIEKKLKELNFKVSTEDISQEDSIKKIKITANIYTNEINNKLVI